MRRPLLLGPGDLDMAKRGFHQGAADVRPKLEAVVRAFATGYNAVIQGGPERLSPADTDPVLYGFAVEGAAMSSALLDLLTLSGGRRVARLHRCTDDRYTHLIHVGVGWAYARLRLTPWTGVRAHTRILRWLAWDGWGFHEAFFRPGAVFHGAVERAARTAARPIRDQGVGRALWFYAGADPARVSEVIDGFASSRRADLWAGIGLAACYTGAQSSAGLERLVQACGHHRPHLAQGAAFAAKARHLSGHVPQSCADAVTHLTGATVAQAAAWTDDALAKLADKPDTPATYERWREQIRRSWSLHPGGVAR
ncbi:DUF1702 family protein [Nonomuraea wenchangensis]